MSKLKPDEPSETQEGSMKNRMFLDNRRTPCAVGLIKAARTMTELEAGTILEIWSRDRFAPMEIKLWASKQGHDAIQLDDGGRWPMRYFRFEVIKRGLDS